MNKLILAFTFLLGTTTIFAQTYGDGVTDIDGNFYKSVIIGDQEWMASNLKVSRYNDGTKISTVTDNTQWQNLSEGASCWYNNDSSSYNTTYGRLYNFMVVDVRNTKNVCPTNWRVPSLYEFNLLKDFLASNTDGTELKSSSGWNNGNNKYGFDAKPGGSRYSRGPFFTGLNSNGNWWSSSRSSGHPDYAHYMTLSNTADSITLYLSIIQKDGISIRCVKDAESKSDSNQNDSDIGILNSILLYELNEDANNVDFFNYQNHDCNFGFQTVNYPNLSTITIGDSSLLYAYSYESSVSCQAHSRISIPLDSIDNLDSIQLNYDVYMEPWLKDSLIVFYYDSLNNDSTIIDTMYGTDRSLFPSSQSLVNLNKEIAFEPSNYGSLNFEFRGYNGWRLYIDNIKLTGYFMDTNKVNITDSTFEDYLIYRGLDDKNNGWVYENAIKNIQELNIQYYHGGSSIEGLKGIEHFSSLKKLSIRNCDLIQEIDLSNNFELEEITSWGNDSISSIEFADSGKLKIITIIGSSIDSISFIKQNTINELNISSTPISSLELINCPNLQKVFVEYNDSLENLKLDSNINLKNLSVIGSNYIDTKIDVSSNIKLRTLKLLNLNINDINLSNNKEITYLDLSNNLLEDIDLSNNRKITCLDLSNNLLENIDLKIHSHLDTLNLSNNDIKEINLLNNFKLDSLDVSRNPINMLDVSKSEGLLKLNINYCDQLHCLNLSNLENLNEVYYWLDSTKIECIRGDSTNIHSLKNLFRWYIDTSIISTECLSCEFESDYLVPSFAEDFIFNPSFSSYSGIYGPFTYMNIWPDTNVYRIQSSDSTSYNYKYWSYSRYAGGDVLDLSTNIYNNKIDHNEYYMLDNIKFGYYYYYNDSTAVDTLRIFIVENSSINTGLDEEYPYPVIDYDNDLNEPAEYSKVIEVILTPEHAEAVANSNVSWAWLETEVNYPISGNEKAAFIIRYYPGSEYGSQNQKNIQTEVNKFGLIYKSETEDGYNTNLLSTNFDTVDAGLNQGLSISLNERYDTSGLNRMYLPSYIDNIKFPYRSYDHLYCFYDLRQFTYSLSDTCGIVGGSITLTNQREVENWGQCEYLQGSLKVEDDTKTDITSLEPLLKLKNIEDDLLIAYGYVNGKVIGDMKNLYGLDSLVSIGRNLRIYDANFNSVSNLSGLRNVGGHLILNYNDYLKDLNGLEGLTNIGGSIQINNNDSLISLKGLDNLSLIKADTTYIFNNKQLAVCCDALPWLEKLSYVYLDNNLEGCNSIVEIEDSCNGVSTENIEVSQNMILIFPNPAEDMISIQGASSSVELINLSGQVVLSKNLQGDNNQIDVSDLTPGIYFLKLESEGKHETHKLIIQ